LSGIESLSSNPRVAAIAPLDVTTMGMALTCVPIGHDSLCCQPLRFKRCRDG
jgi:hypothetical protein